MICTVFIEDTVRARTRSLDRRFCRNEHFCRFFDLLDSAFKTTPIQKVKNHSKIITSDAGSLRICILFWHGVFNKDGARRFSSFGKFPRKNNQKSTIFEAKKEEAAVAPRGVSNSIPSRSKGSCSNREGKITPRLRRPQRPYALPQTQRGQKNWIHRTQAHLRPCATRVTPPS